MPVKLRVDVEGHRALMAKLRTDATLTPPLREAYERIGEIGVQAGRSAAPVKSGQLRASLTYRVMGKKVATAVSIRSTAKRTSPKRRNYPYPKRLEYDKKSRHRLWLNRAIKGAWGRIVAELKLTEQQIEAKWKAV